jgi:hypothetical protein
LHAYHPVPRARCRARRLSCSGRFRAPSRQAWRETDEAGTERSTLVRNLLDGQYENPVRIVVFNTTEGWARDVTVEIADEVRRRFVEYDDVPTSVLDFLDANRR